MQSLHQVLSPNLLHVRRHRRTYCTPDRPLWLENPAVVGIDGRAGRELIGDTRLWRESMVSGFDSAVAPTTDII